MAFNISQALESSIAIAFRQGAGSSSQSQINANARDAITQVINEFANQLFNDVEFMNEPALITLAEFQKLKVDEEEFKSKTTGLNEQLSTVAYLCHSRNLQAISENRSLTDAEQSEISQAFANLAAAHASEKELAGKLSIIEEAAPVVTKVSEAYVKYIQPFDKQLAELLDEVDLPQHVKKYVVDSRNDIFPEFACTRAGLKAIEDASEVPNFESLDYAENVNALSNFILHLALMAKNDKRQMNGSEKEAVQAALTAFRGKMDKIHESNTLFKQADEIKKSLNKTSERLAQLPEKQREKTQQFSEKITGLEKALSDYEYRTQSSMDFEDVKRSVEAGKQKREKELEDAKRDFSEFTRKCAELESKLEGMKEKKSQRLQEAKTRWEAFVNENFETPAIVKGYIDLPEGKLSQFGYIMRYPQVVEQASMLFIDHLTSKVSRLPEEEQGWSLLGFKLW